MVIYGYWWTRTMGLLIFINSSHESQMKCFTQPCVFVLCLSFRYLYLCLCWISSFCCCLLLLFCCCCFVVCCFFSCPCSSIPTLVRQSMRTAQWSDLNLLPTIPNHCRTQFTTFDNFWQLLTTFGNFWQLLTTFGSFWQLLATFVNLWQLLAIFGNF